MTRVLLVYCHPNPESFTAALRDRTMAALRAGGHDVRLTDLHADGFDPTMSCDERRTHKESGVGPDLQRYADDLRWAQALVLVYPTWWSGLPAVLKGWLERVMVPGVGFTLDARTRKVRPGLTHIRRIVGISTYGSPWHYIRLTNDNGRRIITRALRMSCGWRTRTTWLALYALDTVDADRRQRHLEHIETRMAAL